MKTERSAMWKWCAGLSLALGLCVAVPQAQAEVILGWTFGVTPVASAVAGTANANLDTGGTYNYVTRGAGATSASGAGFRTQGFMNNGISTANTDYFQVLLSAASGYTLSVSDVFGNFVGTASFSTGVGVSHQWAYSTDGSTFTLIDPAQARIGNGTTAFDFTGVSALQDVAAGTDVTLRYYASGRTSTGGWGFNSTGFTVNGTLDSAVTEPTTHASSLSFSAVGSSGMTASWTSGDGASRIVVVREGSATSWTPTDGVAPSGVSADFSAATDQADGNKICYNGAGATFDLSGLSAGTTYYVTVFEYNGTGSSVNYLTGGTPLAGNQATASATGIWINPTSAGTPMGSYYLGDTLGDWNVNFEIGAASWDYAQVGLGTSVAGADYNWGLASWYEDGEGSNKRVRRNLNGYQFTAAGSHYVICQARANSGDAYTSKSGNGWDNQTAYPPADLSSAYFTADALTAASDVTAVQDATYPATRVDLGWTQWNSKNVLITIATATPSGSPTQGQAYSANDTFGNQTVVAGSQSGTALEVTGLVPGQTYYFTFYSENSSYYSAGATATAVALDVPQARNTSGGSPEAPATIYLGDTGLTFGFDSWGQVEANYGAAQLWVSYNNADLTGGTASDFTGFVNDEHKSRTSGLFNQTGTWYWGLRMDYGSPYGSNFWYKAASTDWADLSANGAGATLSVTVSAINDAGSQTATRSTTAPMSEIDLTWAKNAQGNNVMVVRKLAAASWTEPTQGQAYAATDSLGAGTVVYNGSGTAVSATGLAEDSTYDFKFYAVNNDYYSAGVTAQASTEGCAPVAPTGLDAVEDYTSFVASWDAVTGATGYRLDVSAEEDFGTPVLASDLIISEYFEGVSGNNKAIEIYNGTGAAVDLSNYRIWMISNGGNWPESTNYPSGTLAAGDVYVFIHSLADYANLTSVADGSSGTLNFNGDDAVGLAKNIEGVWTLIDAVGEDGVDPGAGWAVAGTADATANRSLIRKSSVTGPTTNWAVSRGTTVEDSQWAVSVGGTNEHAANFGSHTFDGGTTPSYVAGFENLAVAGTSQSVTGLTEATTYYFRVRAEGEGGCPSVDSATASATTLEHVRPVFNTTNTLVRESGEGRFFVRLNIAPAGVVTVAVSKTSGDAGITLQGPATLTFNAADYAAWRAVTLEAAEDANSANETAIFQVSGPGVEDAFVDATALDDDIGENIALATGGTTISGIRAGTLPLAIDGVHNDRANYAYTLWTNPVQGTITIDLLSTSSVDRVRLLNWDWTYRTHRYQIQSSINGTDWTMLVDASGSDYQGWDDWSTSGATARYLRFTGLANSVDNGICISEWEVYGTRSPLPQPDVSATNVLVREGGEGRFYVRLAEAPAANTSVSVVRSSGDEGLTVTGGGTLLFKPANWSVWQAVTLAATADGDIAARTATFRISGAGLSDRFVDATVLDDDFAENLALASGGATIRGVRAYVLQQAIDGVHNVRTNYAYTMWTNAVKGYMTIDLQTVSTIERVRLLNWDWTYRTHRYQIESSLNGTDWTMRVDASGANQIGWNEWALEDVSMRYLRFTGLSNSVNNAICIPELEVYGVRAPLDLLQVSKDSVNVREGGDGRFYVRLAEAPAANVTVTVSRESGSSDISVQSGASLTITPANWAAWQAVTLAAAADANETDETATIRVSASSLADVFVEAISMDDGGYENLALASGGTTISGFSAFSLAKAIDGVHSDRTNYAYTVWTNEVQGFFTLDMKEAMTLSRVRLNNWDWSYRTHRYRVDYSQDGVEWFLLVDATTGEHSGWENWELPIAPTARYVRFTGLTNSVKNGICIAELEVYGTRPAGRRSLSASASAESEPVAVITSDDIEPVYESGWVAVDGDPATAWTGQKVGGGYIVLEYAPALLLSALEVDLAEGSLVDIEYLYSLDGEEWAPLPEDMEKKPVSLNFLWLVFPDDGTEAVPSVLEIRPNP